MQPVNDELTLGLFRCNNHSGMGQPMAARRFDRCRQQRDAIAKRPR